MQTRLKMSREGLGLLKEFEGLRLTAARLPDGGWTIGHGHTQYAREGATITPADAEAFLVYDLIPVVTAVNDSVMPQISQNQFDALVCFAFNVGVEAFQQSEVLQRVNQERMTEAALAMAIWRSGAFDGRRVVLDALVRRRSAEEALLLGGEGRPAPSDLVRPEIDPEAQASLPTSRPAEVDVKFDGDVAQAELVEAGPDEIDAVAEARPNEAEPVQSGDDQDGEKAADVRAGATESAVESDHATTEPVPVEDVEDGASAVAESAESLAPISTDPVAGGSEPIVYSGPTTEPSVPLTNASVSTRIYSSYPSEPFSPLAAAQAESETSENFETSETTGLMEPPSLDARIEEPPLVLVLTPPPEVASEPPLMSEVDRIAVGSDVRVDDQAPLFGGSDQVEAVDTLDSVIYYEPLADDSDRSARWSDTGAYVATGIVGLAAFGFGIAGFQLAGQDPVPTGMFDEKTAISWVLVAIGVVCVWIAAYNLFKRLGGSEAE